MLFHLIKKDFLIVKKYVLIVLVASILIPPVMRWRTPEFAGTFGFILSVIFSVFMLLQYVSLKEYQFPKATTLLCATPFSRSMMVLSKYIFCIAIYVACCIIFGIETLLIPGLGTSGIALFILTCQFNISWGMRKQNLHLPLLLLLHRSFSLCLCEWIPPTWIFLLQSPLILFIAAF